MNAENSKNEVSQLIGRILNETLVQFSHYSN